MNFLVLETKNQLGDYYLYEGSQARELIKQHQLSLGVKISALLYDQSQGVAEILEISKDLLKISYQSNQIKFTKQPVTLIVGLCRPQTVKKVLQLSLVVGINQIIFLASQNSEKSYFSSKIWQAEQIASEISLGMSQSGDYLAPELIIYRQFKDFLTNFSSNSDYQQASKYLASTKLIFSSQSTPQSTYSMLAIGPEKGWSLSEEESFLELGFNAVNYGSRIFRIEQAIAFGLGKII